MVAAFFLYGYAWGADRCVEGVDRRPIFGWKQMAVNVYGYLDWMMAKIGCEKIIIYILQTMSWMWTPFFIREATSKYSFIW